MIYKLVFAPIEDLDQTASLRVLYIKARVQSFFKVKTKTDQTLGCADGFEYLLCAHDNLYPAHSYTYYGLLYSQHILPYKQTICDIMRQLQEVIVDSQ